VFGPWRRLRSRRLQDCRVFEVDEVDFEPPGGGNPHPFYCIRSTHWINVIPLTEERQVLLLRQYRFGVEDFTLEIPGGMCDPGESPRDAAARELLEETGYEAADWTELGWVHPNPAIQDNRCYTYLARGLTRRGEPQPDGHEAFEQLQVPLGEIPKMIGARKITHSLVVAAFHLLDGR
jgi:8-oxo-dGTP pyrophosphatase MutT (NUDIX family)